MVPVISIIGEDKKRTTDLVESLVKELAGRGHKIGVIKHHIHDDFQIDIPGKPSYRHWQAGASKVAVSSPTMFAMVSREDDDRRLFEIVEHGFSDVDIVITEGYRQAKTPKIDSSDPESTTVLADRLEKEYLKGR